MCVLIGASGITEVFEGDQFVCKGTDIKNDWLKNILSSVLSCINLWRFTNLSVKERIDFCGQQMNLMWLMLGKIHKACHAEISWSSSLCPWNGVGVKNSPCHGNHQLLLYLLKSGNMFKNKPMNFPTTGSVCRYAIWHYICYLTKTLAVDALSTVSCELGPS